jgi:hypothetical protein
VLCDKAYCLPLGDTAQISIKALAGDINKFTEASFWPPEQSQTDRMIWEFMRIYSFLLATDLICGT